MPVCNEHGKPPGTEYDHWYAKLNNTDFKSAVRNAFESYQFALRRVLQGRQTAQSSLSEMRQSEAS